VVPVSGLLHQTEFKVVPAGIVSVGFPSQSSYLGDANFHVPGARIPVFASSAP